MSTFVGVVRKEDNISALSFDIYEPMLKLWFERWQEKADKKNTTILMAHSIGDVKIGTSSFFCATLSPHRKSSLDLLEKFVEDFKANAPIWKYDIKNGRRIYAKQRSQKLPHSGILV